MCQGEVSAVPSALGRSVRESPMLKHWASFVLSLRDARTG
jgi:hypothetical protein